MPPGVLDPGRRRHAKRELTPAPRSGRGRHHGFGRRSAAPPHAGRLPRFRGHPRESREGGPHPPRRRVREDPHRRHQGGESAAPGASAPAGHRDKEPGTRRDRGPPNRREARPAAQEATPPKAALLISPLETSAAFRGSRQVWEEASSCCFHSAFRQLLTYN